MRLRLNELRKVAFKAMENKRASEAVLAEIKRIFGPSVDVGNSVISVAKQANYVLDSLERQGKNIRESLDDSMLKTFRDHSISEVRKLAARLLPVSEAKILISDEDLEVRHAVARRLSARDIFESLKKNCDDDELNVIYRKKRLLEAQTEKEKNNLTGDSIKQQEFPELSDGYYELLARKFIGDYGLTWQQNWPVMVKQYVNNMKQTNGAEIDGKKLLKHIQNIYDDYEDVLLSGPATNPIKETLDYLKCQMERFDESVDVVDELMSSGLGAVDFIDRMTDVYSIKESRLPASFKKYHLDENTNVVMVPQKASTPHGKAVGERDEFVLDRFVEAWNKRQALAGEPIRLDWYINPTDASTVGFKVTLK